MVTLGEQLVRWLEACGIDTVFGIPGVHTVEMYRGLAASSIHHVTPRHEQGAGFMADGYYRATGRVAAAFVITGPGLTNILTPMAQAYADSIPMLVISSVNRTRAIGMGGDLHEIRNQGLIAAQAAAFSHTITHPAQLPEVLARAFAVFESARPRPVHIQVPLDLFSAEMGTEAEEPGPRRSRGVLPAAPAAQVATAAQRLAGAARPIILAGGGAVGAASVAALAEALDAPVVMTTNGRGILPESHPLAAPVSPSLQSVRDAIDEADCILALGTEFGRTDYDMYDRAPFQPRGTLIRVNVDPEQVTGSKMDDLALASDVEAAVQGLLASGEDIGAVTRDGRGQARRLREAAWDEIGPKYRTIVAFLNTIRDTLPGAPVVCDSTQAAYAGNLYYAAPAPRRWFNASTGYGALGYGLPAAVGAARALDAPVVCIAGDGGVQFSLAELGAAIEEELPVILLVWNNQGYGEIKDYMVSRQITPVGVDLHTPDFVGLGRAYGCEAAALARIEDLPGLLRAAASRKGPTLIEIDEALILG